MLTPDHPLEPLQRLAAVASGRATLWLDNVDETPLVEALAVLEDVLGPLPHAELLEPDERGHFALRIDHELTLDELPRLEARLALPFTAVICPPPEVRACEDLGLRDHEVLAADGLEAYQLFDREDGGLVPLRWVRGQLDEALEALGDQLAMALQRVDAHLVSDFGLGKVDPGMDPVSGRLGVRFTIPPEAIGDVHGDALLARRQQLVDALATVVHARAEHPRVVLAPDALYQTRAGLDVTLWLVAPHAPTRPDGPLATTERALDWLASLEGLLESVELQLVAPEATVLEAAAALERLDAPVVGGPPRWLRTEDGWQLAATWSAEPTAVLAPAMEALAALDGAVLRVVPGAPTGLALRWERLGPTWVRHARGWWMRLRDGVTLDDWLARVEPRSGDARDDAVEQALIEALSTTPGAAPVEVVERRNLLPVKDGLGRWGVELRVARARVFDEAALTATLRALGDVPQVASVGFFGDEGAHLLARLWYPVEGGEHVLDGDHEPGAGG